MIYLFHAAKLALLGLSIWGAGTEYPPCAWDIEQILLDKGLAFRVEGCGHDATAAWREWRRQKWYYPLIAAQRRFRRRPRTFQQKR
jgi:hypothetical protein